MKRLIITKIMLIYYIAHTIDRRPTIKPIKNPLNSFIRIESDDNLLYKLYRFVTVP